MAMNIYMLMQQWNISIPEQLSIIGFDDYTLVSELLNPRLTTVQLPYVEIGEAAAALLIGKIKGFEGGKNPNKMINQIIGPVVWRHSVKNFH